MLWEGRYHLVFPTPFHVGEREAVMTCPPRPFGHYLKWPISTIRENVVAPTQLHDLANMTKLLIGISSQSLVISWSVLRLREDPVALQEIHFYCRWHNCAWNSRDLC